MHIKAQRLCYLRPDCTLKSVRTYAFLVVVPVIPCRVFPSVLSAILLHMSRPSTFYFHSRILHSYLPCKHVVGLQGGPSLCCPSATIIYDSICEDRSFSTHSLYTSLVSEFCDNFNFKCLCQPLLSIAPTVCHFLLSVIRICYVVLH